MRGLFVKIFSLFLREGFWEVERCIRCFISVYYLLISCVMKLKMSNMSIKIFILKFKFVGCFFVSRIMFVIKIFSLYRRVIVFIICIFCFLNGLIIMRYINWKVVMFMIIFIWFYEWFDRGYNLNNRFRVIFLDRFIRM